MPLYQQLIPGLYTPAGMSSGQSPGASGYGGTNPLAAGTFGQNSYAIYGDLEADVVKALSIGLAGRYEHYNNFGGDFVYKVNALYKLADSFSIRGHARHRLPRAVARPVERRNPDDQLRRRQPGPDRHLSELERDRQILWRAAARPGEVVQLRRRLRRQAGPQT